MRALLIVLFVIFVLLPALVWIAGIFIAFLAMFL